MVRTTRQVVRSHRRCLFQFNEFPNPSTQDGAASSSHCDDAMIRRSRMTVAALSQRMDRRFKRVERRFEDFERRVDRRFEDFDRRFATAAEMRAGFESVHAKIDALIKIIDTQYGHHDRILVEHDARLGDLERRVSASPRTSI
jgi:hypothetical protein